MATLTVQPTGDATAKKDTWVYQGATTTNYGTGADIEVGYNPTNKLHGLIQFDLSALPSNAIISSAVLTLKTNGTSPVEFVCNVHRILTANSGWTEAGATWAHAVEDTVEWAGSAGCSTADTDYASTVMGNQTISATNTAYDFTLNVDEVELMVANNAGMLLKSNNEAAEGYGLFYPADDGTEGNRPKIVITYTLPSSNFFAVL